MKVALTIACIVVAAAGCSGGRMEDKVAMFPSMSEIPDASWRALSEKRILFGHQSVGKNIVNGIEDVLSEYPAVRLSIVGAADPVKAGRPAFTHFRVGKNEDAVSKIEHFAEWMESTGKGNVDIAFFKFCYVDITGRTDARRLFERYRDTMRTLREKFPDTTFVHMTVPLTVSDAGIKTVIKRITGLGTLWEYADNVKRNEFNGMILEEYSGKEPVFDLAMAEATSVDRGRCVFELGNKVHYALHPENTKDGGHLNPVGRKAVAKRLLAYLASGAETGKR